MSNIYLNEFDRFIKHHLKPLAYMRYGDDWLCFAKSLDELNSIRSTAINFLNNRLHLSINPKIDFVQPVSKGVSYLGVDIWPSGRRLQQRVRDRIDEKVDLHNVASYRALVTSHEKPKSLKNLNWHLLKLDK